MAKSPATATAAPAKTEAQILADKQAKFVKAASKKVNKAIDALAGVAALSKMRGGYTKEHAEKISKALNDGIDAVETSFLRGLSGDKSTGGFSL